MIKPEHIIEAREMLLENWKEDGAQVIKICANSTPFNGTFNDFLTHCTTCGGNWGGLLLTGIAELYPEVYKAIPEKMGWCGNIAFACLCQVLILLGIDCS